MASLFGLIRRNWFTIYPPETPKCEQPLKFGILGAASIAPMALINPARSHPEVVIQAVAARDQIRAKAYAKKYGIPDVKGTYQELLDDPEIDCVYIPLPNGLHYEWALRALKAGKHVLLEKPSVNNQVEAESLFRDPISTQPGGPVLLEAAHYAFHPAWQLFMTYITPADVVKAKTLLCLPKGTVKTDDIRYRYELGGGAMMDLGFYTASTLTRIFGAVAEECEDVVTRPGSFDVRCDQSYTARYRFPNGGLGEMEGDLASPFTRLIPKIEVEHRPQTVYATDLNVKVKSDEEVVRTRKVTFSLFVMASWWHSIQVDDEYVVRKTGDETKIVKRWKKSKTVKGYTFREAGIDQNSEPYWSTYRNQLEQFVNKVRKREVGQWFGSDESINAVRMIEMAYAAAKLPIRPTSEYKA